MPTDYRVIIYLLAAYVFFALCIRHTIKRTNPGNSWYTLELCTAVLFGFLLEWVGVHVLNYYYYGAHFIEIFNIPLSTPLGWAVIIYAAMLTSDNLGIPNWCKPFMDSFLALQIDLGMDVVATRLGLWTWTMYDESVKWDLDWFGVPWGNYFGWIFTVLFFSLITRYFRKRYLNRKKSPVLYLIIPIVIILLSEVGLYMALEFGKLLQWLSIPDLAIALWPFFVIIPPSLIALRYSKPISHHYGPSLWVPAFYHFYSYALLVFTPLPFVSDLLIMVNSAILLAASLFHFWFIKRTKSACLQYS